MSTLIKAEFKKTIHRKDAIILLVLSLWPALVVIMTKAGSGLFDFSGEAMGAFEFTNILLMFQDLIFLPVLVGVYIASMTLYQEISSRQIYFYKDIPRKEILNAKYFSIYSIYLLYVCLYIAVSFVFYFVLFRTESIATGTFIADTENVIPLLYESIEVILGILFYIHIGIVFSLRTSTGFSIFGTTLFYMFAKITPHLKNIKYVFPIGYREVIPFSSHVYLTSLLLSIVVWLIYNIILYFINKRTFENMEF